MIRATSSGCFFMTELRPPIIGLSAICVPPFIARKVSHCSRNPRGARAFEAFTSVIQTLRRTSSLSIGAAFEQIFASPPSVFSLTTYIDSPTSDPASSGSLINYICRLLNKKRPSRHEMVAVIPGHRERESHQNQQNEA